MMSEKTNIISMQQSLAVHPGRILWNKFMAPNRLTSRRLASVLHVAPQQISEILNGRRGISAETALRLSKLFGTKPKYWFNLQYEYELAVAQNKWSHVIERQIKVVFQDRHLNPKQVKNALKKASAPARKIYK